jgi:translation elongation factor P/translation initiation factor 5A
MVASSLERGNFIIHKNEVLQIVRKSLVNVGTHSHTKLVFTVCDIYGKREREITMGHNDKVDTVDITKKKAPVIAKTGDSIQIMDIVSYETLDAICDADIAENLSVGDEIIFIEYQGIRILGKKKN